MSLVYRVIDKKVKDNGDTIVDIKVTSRDDDNGISAGLLGTGKTTVSFRAQMRALIEAGIVNLNHIPKDFSKLKHKIIRRIDDPLARTEIINVEKIDKTGEIVREEFFKEFIYTIKVKSKP